MDRIRAWLAQTSTKTGLMALATAATGYLMGSMTLSAAVPTAAAGLVGLLFPDNQAATAAAVKLSPELLDFIETLRGKPKALPAPDKGV